MQLSPKDKTRASEALRKARIAAENACRAFDKGSYMASLEACREATGRLQTAIENMKVVGATQEI